MSIDAVKVLRGVVSLPIISGVGMLAMGVGLLPVDPGLGEVSKVFIGDAIPVPAFLRMLGVGKIAAVLSLWGYGPLSHDLAVLGISIPPLCAIYGHYVVEGALHSIPPVVYIVLLVTYFVWSRPPSSGHQDGKKSE